MSKGVLEIRWHGRGGQGAKTAAGMVATIAVGAGKHAQAAPEYGAEREGAPIKAYTRISDNVIRVHDAIYYPDIVLVLDDTLLETQNVQSGLVDDGLLLVNTKKTADQIRTDLDLPATMKVAVIDATTIALEEIKRPIPNTVMIGALAAATGVVDVPHVKKSVEKKFGAKLSEAMLQGNMRALERAAQEVKIDG
jgi:pyruvate ferredoxin oxidoreductase gamma subunit